MTRALVLLLVVAIVALATPTLAAPKCDDPRVIEMMLSQQFSPPFETGKPIDRAAFQKMTDEEITQRLGKMMVDALNRDLPGISDLKLKQGRLRADVSETVYV